MKTMGFKGGFSEKDFEFKLFAIPLRVSSDTIKSIFISQTLF